MFGMVDLPTRCRALHVLHEIGKLKWQRMYDLGCGTGVWTFFFSRDRAKSIVAIDVDRERIEDCIKSNASLARGNVSFEIATVDEFLKGVPAGSADLLLSVEALQYMPRLDETLAYGLRALRAGGHFLAHVPIRARLYPYEKSLFSDRSLRDAFSAAGFEVVRVRPTFGGFARRLFSWFAWLTKHPILMAICFPLLLLLSWVDLLPGQRGDSRLIVARKPVSATAPAGGA